MTDQEKPGGLCSSLDLALSSANWLGPTDIAAMTLSRKLATLLDVAFDTGDIKEIPANVGKYLAVLEQLHLTVATRMTSKQGEESDGTHHVGDYLRLISTKNPKQAAKPANGRASSK